MKKMRIVLSVLVSVLLCLAAMQPAYASPLIQDGLKITFATDKEQYAQQDPIQAILTVKNTSSVLKPELTFDIETPAGYVLAESSHDLNARYSLMPDETLTCSVLFRVLNAGAFLPPTGDDTHLGFYAVLMASALFLLLVVLKHWGRQSISLLLCIALFGGLFADASLAAAAAGDWDSVPLQKTVQAGGQQVVIHAAVQYRFQPPDEIKDLEEKFTFEYFSSLKGAVDTLNAGKTGPGDTDRENAVAAIYTDEFDNRHAVLLKDEELKAVGSSKARVVPNVDMVINLGGHTLSADDAICINVTGGNLTIDGRLEGSSIIQDRLSGGAGCVQIPGSSTAETVEILGGEYIASSKTSSASALNLQNTTCVTTITDCSIKASVFDNKANGIGNKGTVIVTDCSIRAYSNYNLNEAGNFTAMSYGIWNEGNLIAANSNVFGVHSGISTTGPIQITGGTFEGYGHGGIYVGGENNVAKIRNAWLKDSRTRPEGYIGNAPHNFSGMYVGSGSGITVYMDNCDFYGDIYPFILRHNPDEQNNSIYISNSRIDTTKMIRIDEGTDTNKLYIGAGNNFTKDHTARPEMVIETNENYLALIQS